MKAIQGNMMVMSAVGGKCRITVSGPASEFADLSVDQVASIYRAAKDATATELLPMTEAAFRNFVARTGATPIYATLAAYPSPRN